MFLFLTLLLSSLCAQTVPGPPIGRIREYLALTDSQLEALLGNMREQAQDRVARVRRIDELRLALTTEMAREGADPVTLGNLAAERETICREDRASSTAVVTRAREVLTTTQRTRLDELEASRRLEAAILESQSIGLLDGNPRLNDWGVPQPIPGCAVIPTNELLVPGETPTFAAKQYLNLSDAQYRVLSDNLFSYTNGLLPTDDLLWDLSRSITLVNAREEQNPVELGRLYGELASACRSATAFYRELRRAAESILDTTQKARLATLAAAHDLAPVIAEAQGLGLMTGRTGGASVYLIAGYGRYPFLQPVCPVP